MNAKSWQDRVDGIWRVTTHDQPFLSGGEIEGDGNIEANNWRKKIPPASTTVIELVAVKGF